MEDHDCGNDKPPANSNLVQDLLLQLDAYKFIETGGILKELADVRIVSVIFNGLGKLGRSQLTGNWQLFFQSESESERSRG